MTALTAWLLDNLPPESGPWCKAAADNWNVLAPFVMLGFVALLLFSVGVLVGFFAEATA